MPSLETTITVLIVGAGILAALHIFSNARAGVVLAYQKRYEESTKPPPELQMPSAENQAAEPIEVG